MFSRLGLTCLLLVTIVGWGFLACRDNSLLEELRKTKEKVCQCQHQDYPRACVDALRASSQALEARLQEVNAADQEKAQAIAIEMMACLQKI